MLQASLNFYMAGVTGIEPALTVLETVVLPLNYTPVNAHLNVTQNKHLDIISFLRQNVNFFLTFYLIFV